MVAALLVVSLISLKLIQAEPLSSTPENYDEINNHLTIHVSSNDVDENMAKAEEWLLELKSTGGFSLRDSPLEMAIKEVLQLKKAVTQCTYDAYALFARTNKLTGNAVTDKAKEQSTWRIDMIIQYYANKHSDTCVSVWPQKLAEKLDTLTPESRKYVMKLAERMDTPWEYNLRIMEYVHLLRSYLEADHEHQNKMADKKYFYEKRMISLEDYKKYLLDPCEEMKQKVIDELDEPIQFDVFLQREKTNFYNDEFKEFRVNRRAMEFCKYILANNDSIWSAISKVMNDEKEEEMQEISQSEKAY